MSVPNDWPQRIRAAGGEYVVWDVFNGQPLDDVMVFEGVDLTAATFEGGVRAAFEEDSPVLRAFTFGTPTLVGDDTVVTIAITEANIEALREGDDPGAIEQLFYSIKCTPAGGSKQTWFAGPFNLQGA